MAVAAIWGASTGQPGYTAEYDFNANGQIDVFDIMQVAGHWGETCSQSAVGEPDRSYELRAWPGLRALLWDRAAGRLLGLSRSDLLVLSDDPITRYRLGQDLRALAAGADGEEVYVADAAAGRVLVVDVVGGETVARIDGLSGPAGIALSGDSLWVAEGAAGRLALVNRRTYGIIRRVPVGAAPGALAYDNVRGRLYVLVTGQGSVAVVNDGGAVVTSWPVGGLGFPQGMALDAPGGRLYVSYAISSRRGGIAVFDLAHGQRVDTWRGTLFAPLDPLLTLELSPLADQLFAIGAMRWWEF